MFYNGSTLKRAAGAVLPVCVPAAVYCQHDVHVDAFVHQLMEELSLYQLHKHQYGWQKPMSMRQKERKKVEEHEKQRENDEMLL